jgi:hypothetical protein
VTYRIRAASPEDSKQLAALVEQLGYRADDRQKISRKAAKAQRDKKKGAFGHEVVEISDRSRTAVKNSSEQGILAKGSETDCRNKETGLSRLPFATLHKIFSARLSTPSLATVTTQPVRQPLTNSGGRP